LGFTASLLDLLHKKEIVWRYTDKFACCVLRQGT